MGFNFVVTFAYGIAQVFRENRKKLKTAEIKFQYASTQAQVSDVRPSNSESDDATG